MRLQSMFQLLYYPYTDIELDRYGTVPAIEAPKTAILT